MDELVLLEQSINVLNGPLILMQFLHYVVPSYTMHIFEGFFFCSVRYLLSLIAFYHRAIGGLGIAVVRVFCTSFPFAVIHVGAEKLMKCTSGMTCFLTILFAVANYVDTFKMAPGIIEWIFNESKFVEVEKFMTDYLSKSYVQFIISYSCLVINVAELICFTILLVELYKRHSRQKELCLQKEVKLARLKNKRNAVTTLGHFTSWSVEIIIFGFAHYFLEISKEITTFNIWIIIYFALLVPCINYVIFPTVQALTSKDLRDHVFNLAWIKDIFLCIPCQQKINENNGGSEISQGIELQLLENGNTANSNSGCSQGIELHLLENGNTANFNSGSSGSKNDSTICSFCHAHTQSCIFPHEVTAPITPRHSNLSRTFSL